MVKLAKFTRRKVQGAIAICITLIVIFSPLGNLLAFADSSVPWWNPDWAFRRSITVNHAMVMADLENFPVLIDLTDSSLMGKVQSDAADIVLVDLNNNTLKHEVELYDESVGHLVVWVKIPLLSSVQDTVFYMYYGNPTVADQQDPTAVWDSSYVLVQHLEENSGTRSDSTANNNDATPYNGVAKASVGKIDGADQFDGVNDYLRMADSPSLDPSGAITIELWINLLSTGNYINLVSKGNYGQYYLRLGSGEGRAYWYVKFSDGSSKSIEGPVGWTWNNWHYLVAFVDTQTQTIKISLDGADRLLGTFSAGKNLIPTSNALVISDASQRWVKGTVDETRISNTARSQAWIQTSCNTEKYPFQFSFVGDEEGSGTAPSGPFITDEVPVHGSTGIYTNPTLSVRVTDMGGLPMNVTFIEEISGVWTAIRTYENVPNGVYSANATNMTNLGTLYHWRVTATNGESPPPTKTFSLTTTTNILVQKWLSQRVPRGTSGVLTYDVNGDGKEEIFMAGIGGIACLNPENGRIIWSVSDSELGDRAQPEMADLDKDGNMEIIVLREGEGNGSAGAMALHADTGAVYWNITGLGRETYGGSITLDIDGTGYPTVFVASTDIYNGINGTGRLTAISYNGTILRQIFAWRPCGGGLSIADTDGDGEFELYMSDRDMYLNSPIHGDNDYGRGLQSYWASNFSLRWYRPDILCSSQKPMIADANNDGKLDVIIGDLSGGVLVANATDGSTIRMKIGVGAELPTHYQPTVYDIDRDGHLEFISTDGSLESVGNGTVVWDLVNMTPDAYWQLGRSSYGPRPADVTGDGVMELIAASETSITLFSSNYAQLTQITGLAGTLNYAVVQDIDGDGYNELLMSSSGGWVYAFDTPARRPNPRPRSEVQFYSEYRQGAAEFVQPQGGPAPVITLPSPANFATGVLTSNMELAFTVTDYQHDLMNMTVTTFPDIGSTTLLDTGNGRYSLNVGDLQYSMTYTWTVTATDGNNTTTQVYIFTTQDLSPWWNDAWPYRKPITIDHSQIIADLQDFPVLVDTTDQALTDHAKNDGHDIAFADTCGTKLSHEIEFFDHDTGHIIAWVKVPQLSSVADTRIYMYYGNSAASDQQNPAQVWDSGYVMTQHLEEVGTRLDSTVNDNDATPYNGVAKASFGMIDGADQFDGVNDSLRIADSPSLNPSGAITIELWMKLSSTGTYINLVSKGSYGQYYLRLGPDQGRTYWSVKFSDGTSISKEGYVGWTWNNWHYLVVSIDTGTRAMKMFLDGTEKLTGAFGAGKSIISTSNPLLMGDSSQPGRQVKGSLDEVRVSSTARSASWILASYSNQKNPSAFRAVGNEETIPESPIIFCPSPEDNEKNVVLSLSQLEFNLTDSQNDLMNYTVTAYPDIINGPVVGEYVSNGKISVSITSGLIYGQKYTWNVSATDGLHVTENTYAFTIVPSEPPAQGDPTLQFGTVTNPPIICRNQSTYDADGDSVTNTYHWFKNNVSTTNLQFSFDTNTTQIQDYSGYGNTGTAIHGATWTSSGRVGGAYDFNRGFIQVPASNTLDGGGDWTEMTIEQWVYLTADQGTNPGTRIIARIPSYEICIAGKSLYAGIWVATGDPMVSGHHKTGSIALQTGQWYHVVFTYKSGVGMTLYVRNMAGVLYTASVPSISGKIQPAGSVPLYIGWFDYFKGRIDEVRIYPESLSTAQISQRYQETKNGLSSNSTIVNGELTIGETWTCEVTPSDSHVDGQTMTSNSIVIGQNNPPSIKSVQITPENPTGSDVLTATPVGWFDPDNDLQNYTYEWQKYTDGQWQNIAGATAATLSPLYFGPGDQIRVICTPYDGQTYGASKEDTVIIS